MSLNHIFKFEVIMILPSLLWKHTCSIKITIHGHFQQKSTVCQISLKAIQKRNNIISSLPLLLCVFHALSLAYIHPNDGQAPSKWYNSEVDEYVTNVKKLYAVDVDCFQSKSRKGDGETFYFHVMQFYNLSIAFTI